MSERTPVSTVNRFCDEVINAHNPEAADTLVAEDFSELDPLPGQQPGRVGLQQWLAGWFAAFPDLTWINEQQIAEGEHVVTRFHWTGTHQQEFLGIPATGARVNVNGVVIDRVINGQMTDSRMLMNSLSMLQQLGANPT
jgi:steroid delta-isomerase-like uncharacterized protein